MEEITKADVVEYLKRKAEEFHYKGKFALSKVLDGIAVDDEILDCITKKANWYQVALNINSPYGADDYISDALSCELHLWY